MATDVRRVPTVQNRPRTGRRQTRRPRHNYAVEFMPYELAPFLIAPVGAGDSIKAIRFESRVLSDPLKNQVAGWWAEKYFFYVPLSVMGDDASTTDIAAQLVSNAEFAGQSGLDQTTRNWQYFRAGDGAVNWLHECYKPIVRSYFRREGEDWDEVTSAAGLALVGHYGKSFLDAVHDVSDFSGGAVVDDYEGFWEAYQQIRAQKLISADTTFEEYLRSQGVSVPAQLRETVTNKRKPELLKFVRQFTYPTNTVNPAAAGEQVSAVSWVVAERMDRRIFCNQPGFIVGLATVRPKVYSWDQASYGAGLLRTAREWLPNDTVDAPQNSLIKINSAGTEGVLATAGETVVDMAGLWALGDQFVDSSRAPMMTGRVYPLESDIKALFADTEGTHTWIQMDGTAAFSITGTRRLATIV